MAQNTCLIIGGTGPIGSAAALRFAAAGFRTAVFARNPARAAPLARQGIRICHGDLWDTTSLGAALAGQDVVVHAGDVALSDPRYRARSRGILEDIVRVAGANPGFQRLVYTSALSAALETSAHTVTESTPITDPLEDRYSAQKRASEAFIAQSGLPATVLRPPWVYGPGIAWMVSLCRAARKAGRLGMPFPGSPEASNPLIHIADLARAYVLAATVPQPRYNLIHAIDSGRATLGAFLATLAAGVGGIRFRFFPAGLELAAARLAERLGIGGGEPNFSAILRMFSGSHEYPNTKFLKELGITLEYPGFATGMPGFAVWIRSQIDAPA